MAMQDYFITCYKIESQVVSDGIGGYEVEEYLGINFKGLPIVKGSTEQIVGAIRGKEQKQYTFHTIDTMPLKKDDKVMYRTPDGVKHYIRLTSSPVFNTDKSTQTEWKSYDAESYQGVLDNE